jgi:hypothetical protein
MAESQDNSADGEKSEPEAVKAHDSKSIDRNLPMVVAPKLGAGEDEAIDEAPAEPAEETVASAMPAHSARFLMLAASVAFAATFGSFVGSVSGSGFVRYFYPMTPEATTERASAESSGDALRAIKQQLAELSTIKANLDTASRSTTTQIAKIADRLDRLDQHASTETTGSIASAPASASAPVTEQPKLTDRILQDWIVQDVQNGRALVESRSGGVFDVGAGSVLPGVGRVDAVKRQDGQWLVLTARGTITSGR